MTDPILLAKVSTERHKWEIDTDSYVFVNPDTFEIFHVFQTFAKAKIVMADLSKDKIPFLVLYPVAASTENVPWFANGKLLSAMGFG